MRLSDLKTYIETWDVADASAIANAIYKLTGESVDGVVADFNAAVLGFQVKDDIVKLAVLLRAYLSKIGGVATAEANKAKAAAEALLSNIYPHIYIRGEDQTWKRGWVKSTGNISYDQSIYGERYLITDAVAIDGTFDRVIYAGASTGADEAQYYAYLSQFSAAGFVRRDYLNQGGGLSVINIDQATTQIIMGITSDVSLDISIGDEYSLICFTNDQKKLSKEVYDVQMQLAGNLVPITGVSFTAGTVNATNGRVLSSDVYVRSQPVPVNGHSYITYKQARPYIAVTSGIAFYDASYAPYPPESADDHTGYDMAHFISGVRNAVSGTGKSSSGIHTVRIPPDAAYVRFVYWLHPTDYASTDFSAFWSDDYENRNVQTAGNKLEDEARRLELHTIPESIGTINAIKRARQMTDILWTAGTDLPRIEKVTQTPGYDESSDWYVNSFNGATQYRGIPYGRCNKDMSKKNLYGYPNFYVGLQIPFETFVTAAKNTKSFLAVQGAADRVAPPVDGVPALVDDHASVQYAMVCSALAAHVFGYTNLLASSQIRTSSSYTARYKYGANNATVKYLSDNNKLSLLSLCDVLVYDGSVTDHTVIITDIQYGNDGNPVIIEASEATVVGNGNELIVGGPDGGICRRKAYPAADFVDRFGVYEVFVYNNLSSVTYTQDKYARIDGEMEMYAQCDYPVMPYEGNGFTYMVVNGTPKIPGNKIRLVIEDEDILTVSTNPDRGYNALIVYKDGERIDTTSGYTIEFDAENVEYKLSGNYVTQAGSYAAVLVRLDNDVEKARTAACTWIVKIKED